MRHLKYGLVFGLLLVCLIIPCLMRTPKCCLRKTFEGNKLDETKWYPKSEWNTGEFIKTPY